MNGNYITTLNYSTVKLGWIVVKEKLANSLVKFLMVKKKKTSTIVFSSGNKTPCLKTITYENSHNLNIKPQAYLLVTKVRRCVDNGIYAYTIV